MEWSKLRKTLEERVAPALRRRVKFVVARYRSTNALDGRGTIQVDGEEILECCDAKYRKALNELAATVPEPEAAAALALTGVIPLSGFMKALEASLNTSIESALDSDDVVLNALAVLDPRLGKRRLKELGERYGRHPALSRLYEIRCEAEGIARER